MRRLFVFLERSIYEGTQWVVFEPNDDRLWARVIDTIRLFLRTGWRFGARLKPRRHRSAARAGLFGPTPGININVSGFGLAF